ncbi:phosphotransferase enzyme family protein [Nannizzia gypsea CBS 118893]|uniref:Phosphotransferase enzyme family protein n=1 Tax=Arthroderma gypseum (strain ATCC MYA-4604 / CBS 118893) TaxID=535722 RepID=E4UZJ4_ARTGP|nr:phosphotransferase enzyme family protein [Nannizzia gypsea CBS 118893]EFR03524.1 phosphotransferase enzyme family protein [Nannizzia gypsea CBS 118893]
MPFLPQRAELPSPANVREQGIVQDPTLKGRDFSFRPVHYEQLGLIVKYGRAPQVTVAEGQLLWVLRRVLPTVPVPEAYGWTHDKGQVFIYMELVQGFTLEQRWGFLDQAERIEICKQLRAMILELRKLQHAPGDFFLGHINREPLGDIVFTNANYPPAGPFLSVTQFHDWMARVTKIGIQHHWDGIPDYWELCKAEYTADVKGEWMNMYIPLFLNEPRCLEAWEFYARSFGY